MNSHTIATMENGLVGCGGRLELPWNGWEEQLFTDCTALFQDETEDRGLSAGQIQVKAEFDSSYCCASVDRTSGLDRCFDSTNDFSFSGDLVEICPLSDRCDIIGLPELFEGSQSILGPGFLDLLETNTEDDCMNGSTLHQLAGDEVNSFLHLGKSDNEYVCIMSTDDSNCCEVVLTSTAESDWIEELVVTSSEALPDIGNAGVEHMLEERLLDDEDDDKGDDDDDWEWTRKRKKNEKRKRSSSSEHVKKFVKLDPQLRKKEQNKNAATRYREKKKVEEMERQALCDMLESRNRELRKEIGDKENEVKLLKELLVTVLRPASRI